MKVHLSLLQLGIMLDKQEDCETTQKKLEEAGFKVARGIEKPSKKPSGKFFLLVNFNNVTSSEKEINGEIINILCKSQIAD